MARAIYAAWGYFESEGDLRSAVDYVQRLERWLNSSAPQSDLPASPRFIPSSALLELRQGLQKWNAMTNHVSGLKIQAHDTGAESGRLTLFSDDFYVDIEEAETQGELIAKILEQILRALGATRTGWTSCD